MEFLQFITDNPVSLTTFFALLLYILKREGILRKVRVWIRIGGNGNPGRHERRRSDSGNPENNPGNPNGVKVAIGEIRNEIKNMKETQKKSEKEIKEDLNKVEKNNREDHQKIFGKIEEIRVKIGP